MEHRILPQPLQPSGSRRCDRCGRRFALVLEAREPSEMQGELRTYVCKYCQAKVTYAERHPPGVV